MNLRTIRWWVFFLGCLSGMLDFHRPQRSEWNNFWDNVKWTQSRNWFCLLSASPSCHIFRFIVSQLQTTNIFIPNIYSVWCFIHSRLHSKIGSRKPIYFSCDELLFTFWRFGKIHFSWIFWPFFVWHASYIHTWVQPFAPFALLEVQNCKCDGIVFEKENV